MSETRVDEIKVEEQIDSFFSVSSSIRSKYEKIDLNRKSKLDRLVFELRIICEWIRIWFRRSIWKKDVRLVSFEATS